MYVGVKYNKTFQIVTSLQNGLYKKYLNGDIVLQDIANQFNVSVQHVAAVIKDNNIGVPSKQKKMHREEAQHQVKQDIENGLPVEFLKDEYKIFEGLSGVMNVFNTITRWVRKEQITLTLPYITESKLKKLILDINIMKFINKNKNYPKHSKMRLVDIADLFNVSFGVVGTISSYLNKGANHLLPNQNNELVKVIMRNLDMVEDITYSNLEHEEAIEAASKKYSVKISIIKKILLCEPYIEGANIEEYIKTRHK